MAAMNLIIAHGFEVNYTLGFVRGLAANGVEVCVVSSDDDERALTASGVSNVNLRGSVDPSRSRVSKIRNLLGYYGRLARLLWRRRADTVHFTGMFRNDLFVLEGLVLPPLFRLLSRRYIYTAHNAVPHGKRGKRLYEWVYRFVYAMPHFILVNTEPVKQQLITRLGVASTRIVLTSIGLNEEVPATGLSAEEAKCARGWDGSEKILLLFGKIHPYKGVELLVQSFDRLETAGTRLVIAGTFQDAGYRRTITGAIAAARRSSQISLEERLIPNEEVESYFKGADLLVLPYTDISQSGVLFLAMRFGLPIVATDVRRLSRLHRSGDRHRHAQQRRGRIVRRAAPLLRQAGRIRPPGDRRAGCQVCVAVGVCEIGASLSSLAVFTPRRPHVEAGDRPIRASARH